MKVLTLDDLLGELTPVVSDFEMEPSGRVKSNNEDENSNSTMN